MDVCDCGITAHPTFETGLVSSMISVLRVHAFSAIPFEESKIDISELSAKNLILLDSTNQSRRVLGGAFQIANKVPKVGFEGRSARAILVLSKAGQFLSGELQLYGARRGVILDFPILNNSLIKN